MAGGKETPRQKMIGMMYLVLTALLALQVSNSVLEKFIFINKSLEISSAELDSKNKGTIERIIGAVEETGGKDKDVLVQAQEVRKRTTEIIQEMEDLKAEFIKITGGLDDSDKPKGVKNLEAVANLMINQKRGYELQNTLNGYAKYLEQVTGKEVHPIALDAKDNPVFRKDPNQQNKDFPTLTFDQTPMAAGLASISQLQTEVLQRETQALEELARRVGASMIKFESIFPVVKPESKVVAAGTKYQAELFIAASSSAANPTMMVDGKPIPVVDGKGKVEFVATPAASYVDGVAKKSFKATITMPLGGGREETFEETIEYFVAQPVLQIQSASVQALFLNCGNELNVQVPALGAAYNPDFSATNAAVYKGQEKGIVTIVPNGPEVTLNVSSAGNPIGSQKFKVRGIPRPEIKYFGLGGKELNAKVGENGCPRQVTVKAIPDESFRQFLPKDARYRVTEWEITLVRGPRPVLQPKSVKTSETVDLSDFAAQAKSGDRLVIEIKKVERMNFRDQREVVNIPPTYGSFSIN